VTKPGAPPEPRYEDERLARDLLYGKTKTDKLGRWKHVYLSGADERAALAALCRLLEQSPAIRVEDGILRGLINVLDPEATKEPRQLVFRFRGRGNRADRFRELQIYLLVKVQKQKRTAVAKQFGLRVRQVDRIVKRINMDIRDIEPGV
jgi:hypothetical protein